MLKYKFFFSGLFFLFSMLTSLHASDVISIKDVSDLKFVHSLDYYLDSARKKSPLLWEEKSTSGFLTSMATALPTMSYSRDYTPEGENTNQTLSISLDIGRIIQKENERLRQIEKNKFIYQDLVKHITSLYLKALNSEQFYLKMVESYETNLKIYNDYEKVYKNGGVSSYQLSQIKSEILDTELRILKAKNEMIDDILELYYSSGILIHK